MKTYGNYCGKIIGAILFMFHQLFSLFYFIASSKGNVTLKNVFLIMMIINLMLMIINLIIVIKNYRKAKKEWGE